jgi:hypothetical protein
MPNQGSKNPRVYSGSIKNPSDSDMVAVRINLESAKEQPGNAQ